MKCLCFSVPENHAMNGTATQRGRCEVPLLQWQTWKARHWDKLRLTLILTPRPPGLPVQKRCFMASAPGSPVF